MKYVLSFLLFSLMAFSQQSEALSDESFHLIAELNECSESKLNDEKYLKKVLHDGAAVGGFKTLESVFHQFKPQGVTGVVLLSESHLSIHTWPENKYAALDLFTCGNKTPEESVRYIQEKLECKKSETLLLERRNNITVKHHIVK